MNPDPLILDRPTPTDLDRRLVDPLWTPATPLWRLLFAGSAAGTTVLAVAVTYTVLTGIGTWGNDIPAAWGFGITNMVWWIGIGHAGTFISAFLLLLEQGWRSSVNRIAEAMTLFALANAALFPILHLGRPWLLHWFFPYPSTMGVWPQIRSSLMWDVGAISTYVTVSILFFYVGLIPDLATVRDRAPERWRRRLYGIAALGWRGSSRHWRTHRYASRMLAGIATPLVVSVHTVISFDFATAITPGWHSTIFPPFFVIGALHSGFALVLVLLIALRIARPPYATVVTPRHLDALAKLLLTTGMLMAYSYGAELFTSWYTREPPEVYTGVTARLVGPDAVFFWAMIATNCLAPMFLWSPALRRSPPVLTIVGLLVLVGMWLERFVIIVRAQTHDYLPSSWGTYVPTPVDAAILIGTMSFFTLLFLLFVQYVPPVPVAEVKVLAHEEEHP